MSKYPESHIERALAYFPELRKLCGDVCGIYPQSGLTNRVFRLITTTGDFILRLPRPETAPLINRFDEAHNHEAAASLEIAVPPVFTAPKIGLQLTRTLDHAPLDAPDLAACLGETLARLHGKGPSFKGTIDPKLILAGHADEFQGRPDLLRRLAPVQEVLEKTGVLESRSGDFVSCHGDLSPGNLLYSEGRLVLIDWEYSGQSEPAWDLAYATLENGFNPETETTFLEAYCGGQPGNALVDRYEAMKSVCDTVSAAWALGQVAASREPDRFSEFAQTRIDRALARLTG
ncbi:choline/ethanolamine kinase family protein [Roseibium sp. RKSG952]|uniref:choline/ethanolamine kinase family protein n=1 Tax=Roseibium sp. RKSG952 TaxID=2529384 RepID=UPI0018AD264B|nr:choline/ethanolamine kinase family protein [Roseibium sp. RKSG952]